MTAQHTQGPWEIARLNGNGPYAIRMAYNPEQKFYGVRQVHHEADARLIAAAPELLTQLEYAVKLLGAFPALNGTAQVQSMRDTIAKATGADQ